MNKDSILKSPNLNLSADANKTVTYQRDACNYITQVFEEQLPAIRTGLFNVHMNKGFVVQPHWHTNVNELVFVISGEVVTSVFDPYTQKLKSYRIKPGQVSMLPLGWFHWIVAMKDDTHFLTIFDEATPDIVYGSDFLRFTPKEIMNLAYCVDEEKYAAAVAPIQESIILGPPLGCKKRSDSVNPLDETQSSPLSQSGPFPQRGVQSPQGYSSDGYGWNEAHPFNYYYPQGSYHPYKSY